MAQYARVDAACYGLTVVVDLSYAERMSAKGVAGAAALAALGANRRPRRCAAFAGLGRCPPAAAQGRRGPAVEGSPPPGGVVDAFPLSSLVFLSPDADEPLPAEPDPRSVLGGLIGAQVQKCQTLGRARGAGARDAAARRVRAVG